MSDDFSPLLLQVCWQLRLKLQAPSDELYMLWWELEKEGDRGVTKEPHNLQQ
jgi:hypothetical protein